MTAAASSSPSKRRPFSDVAKADALFIADTYGVYRGDYALPGDVAALERSPKIYGGLTMAEAEVIRSFVQQGGVTVAEFNTFASPTQEDARAQLESVFGAHWTHWIARYWNDLTDDTEVPAWLLRLYKKRYGQELDRRGAALTFILEDDDIVVLRVGVDVTGDIVSIARTTLADPAWPEASHYSGWLDVCEARGGDVVFEYRVDATDQGQATLAAHGVPRRFPAVFRKGSAWYFAGNFVDNGTDRGSPERAGVLAWRRLVRGGVDPVGGVFWSWYAPLLTRILEPVFRPADPPPSLVARLTSRR